MAKTQQKAPARVAGSDPDAMPQGGLPDDFDGTILKARYCPWNYAGKLDKYILAVGVTILPDPNQEVPAEEFTQYYSAGDLGDFVPGDGFEGGEVDIEGWDGKDITEVEGTHAHAVGKKDELPGGSNWAFFLKKMREAGFAKEDQVPDISYLDGQRAHFTQLDQPKRSGFVTSDEEEGSERKFKRTILCIAELLEEEGASAKSKPKSAPKATPPKTKSQSAPAEEDEDEEAESEEKSELDTNLEAAIITAINDAGGTLPVAKLVGVAIAAFKKDPGNKAAAMNRVKEKEFLDSSDLFAYDAKKQVLVGA